MIEIAAGLAVLAIGGCGWWLAGRQRPPATPKPIEAAAPGEYHRSSGTGSATGLENV